MSQDLAANRHFTLSEDRKFAPHRFCHRIRDLLPPCSLVRRLLPNQALYTCGTDDDNIYFIETGCFKILTLCRGGKECLLDVCTQGEILGESCLLSPERMETAMAMTPSVLRVIRRTQFLTIILSQGLYEESLQYFTLKLSEQRQIITQFVTADSERRLAATLLRLARKLGTRSEGKLWIDERITQEELAEIVGTTRSRVGYFLKRFRAARLIEGKSQEFLVINEHRMDEYVQTWA
jgi:CRP-like cAMP-binding protein